MPNQRRPYFVLLQNQQALGREAETINALTKVHLLENGALRSLSQSPLEIKFCDKCSLSYRTFSRKGSTKVTTGNSADASKHSGECAKALKQLKTISTYWLQVTNLLLVSPR